MKGRIVQVREYTDKPNKYLVVEVTDERGLHYIMSASNGGRVRIEDDWQSDD